MADEVGEQKSEGRESELLKLYKQYNSGKKNNPAEGSGDNTLQMIEEKLKKLAEVAADPNLAPLADKPMPEIESAMGELIEKEKNETRKGQLNSYHLLSIDSKQVAYEIDGQLSALIHSHTEEFTLEQRKELIEAAKKDLANYSNNKVVDYKFTRANECANSPTKAEKAAEAAEKAAEECRQSIIDLSKDADLINSKEIPAKERGEFSEAVREINSNEFKDKSIDEKKALLESAIKPLEATLNTIDEKKNQSLFTKIKNVIETAVEAKITKRTTDSKMKYEEAKSVLTKPKNKELIKKVSEIKQQMEEKGSVRGQSERNSTTVTSKEKTNKGQGR